MSRNKSFLVFICAFLMLGTNFPARAGEGGGHGTGNGGDSLAMEFYAIGMVFVKALTTDPAMAAKFPEVKVGALQTAVENTIVRESADVLRDELGNQKTAINYWENGKAYIKVRREIYDALPTLMRQRLVFHEYLGVLGLEKSDDYRIANRLDVVLSRPMFGLCEAKLKHEVCSVGLRFDPTTRSLDGAYTCRAYERREKDTDIFSGSSLIGEELKPQNTSWESVRIWPDKGSSIAGFTYRDHWLQFSVPSSPASGLRLPFKMIKRSVHLTRPEEEQALVGSCMLVYR